MSDADPIPKVLKTILAVVLIGPIVVFFFDPKLGAGLLLLGLVIAITTSRALSARAGSPEATLPMRAWRRPR